MRDISVYIASSDNSYICGDDQIYITIEEDLKNQIKDAFIVQEQAQKEHLTYLESEELRELSRAVALQSEG